MVWTINEVINLCGIFDDIVEFFCGSFAEVDAFKVWGEGIVGVGFSDVDHEGSAVAVLGLEENAVEHVVAGVAVSVGADGANAVDGVVESVFGGAEELAWVVIGGEEVLCFVPFGDGDAGPGECGGGEVEGVDEVVADGAGFCADELCGAADDHGDVEAAFGGHLFVADEVVGAVVGEVNDDGIVVEVVFCKAFEDEADLVVVHADGIVVLGDDFTVELVLGVVGGDGDFGGVGFECFGDVAGVGFSAAELDLAEERLTFFGEAPGGVALFFGDVGVRCGAVGGEVVIGFTDVEGEVAALLHELGKDFDVFG